jgi:hypothetical protein
MQAKPLFLGACALASIAGAISGATTNTRPIQKAGIGSELLPRAEISSDPGDLWRAQPALPDHYAMTTPDGRVEVAELATRGLYAQQRFGWREADYEPAPPPPLPEPQSEWAGRPVEGEPAFAPPAARSSQEPAQPASVSPRVIDVAAELAG